LELLAPPKHFGSGTLGLEELTPIGALVTAFFRMAIVSSTTTRLSLASPFRSCFLRLCVSLTQRGSHSSFVVNKETNTSKHTEDTRIPLNLYLSHQQRITQQECVCYAHKSHATQQRLGSLFIDRYELQAPPHDPPHFQDIVEHYLSPMIPCFQDIVEHYLSPMIPCFQDIVARRAPQFMLPRSASHEAATSPISWLSTWQPQLLVSAASAADLEGPLSKSPRPC